MRPLSKVKDCEAFSDGRRNRQRAELRYQRQPRVSHAGSLVDEVIESGDWLVVERGAEAPKRPLATT
jgi:hypothetical protein